MLYYENTIIPTSPKTPKPFRSLKMLLCFDLIAGKASAELNTLHSCPNVSACVSIRLFSRHSWRVYLEHNHFPPSLHYPSSPQFVTPQTSHRQSISSRNAVRESSSIYLNHSCDGAPISTNLMDQSRKKLPQTRISLQLAKTYRSSKNRTASQTALLDIILALTRQTFEALAVERGMFRFVTRGSDYTSGC